MKAKVSQILRLLTASLKLVQSSIFLRFGNYLKNNCLAQAHQLDLAVIELATKAIARLTQVSGMYTANLKFDFIDHEVKKAFEWLSAPERNEGRRHAAVMVLREIAYCMPTFFFQVHFLVTAIKFLR